MMGGLQYNTQHRFENMKDVVTDDSDAKGCESMRYVHNNQPSWWYYTTINIFVGT